MTHENFIGWDIGGAHLKAALWQPSRQCFLGVRQIACPLWRGIDHLTAAFDQILADWPFAHRHAITMTGELVDGFADRVQGVAAIIDCAAKRLPGQVAVYCGREGWRDARRGPWPVDSIASANWLASVCYAARHYEHALLIDIGSTTSDLLLIRRHHPAIIGWNDFERLASEELLYTGVTRTPIMAITPYAYFAGQRVGLMAEWFATTADVYRITGELDEAHDHYPPADGGAKTREASMRRLARMLGRDFVPDEIPQWHDVARQLRAFQLQRLHDAALRQLSRIDGTPTTLLGAGVGRFLVRPLAERLVCPYQDFDRLLPPLRDDSGALTLADCLPAVAVVLLLAEDSCNSASKLNL